MMQIKAVCFCACINPSPLFLWVSFSWNRLQVSWALGSDMVATATVATCQAVNMMVTRNGLRAYRMWTWFYETASGCAEIQLNLNSLFFKWIYLFIFSFIFFFKLMNKQLYCLDLIHNLINDWSISFEWTNHFDPFHVLNSAEPASTWSSLKSGHPPGATGGCSTQKELGFFFC